MDVTLFYVNWRKCFGSPIDVCVRDCSKKPTASLLAWRGLVAESPTEFTTNYLVSQNVLNEGTPKE